MPTVPPTRAPAAPVPYVHFTDFNAVLAVEYDAVASKALGKDYWRVTQGFKFYFNNQSENTWVYVPAGYLTDGATVPRPFWSIIPPWGAYGQAAVLHDWLCEHLTVVENGCAVDIRRADADRAFKEGMAALNVPRWKRNLMYIAVRVYAKFKKIKGPAINAEKAAYEAEWVKDHPYAIAATAAPSVS